MAIALTLKRPGVHGVGRELKATFTLVFSGSYPGSGGDTLDLRPYFPGNAIPTSVVIRSSAGYAYDYVAGTNLSNGKVRVGVNTGAGANLGFPEHTTAAYNAAVIADVVTVIAHVAKFA